MSLPFSGPGYFGGAWLTRLLLQRGMAALYLLAFFGVKQQFKPLLGEDGLLPVPAFLERAGFRDAPSLFQWRYSDRGADLIAWSGIVLSLCALSGLSDGGPVWISVTVWLLLYVLYLSVVNVGQTFFGFGWEAMLLEAGFFTAFLGPAHMQPSILPVLILRWMLFRTEMGAGLIKLRHDPCWRDLTCLFWHYETQPLPNPLSWYFHRLPKIFHRFSVLFSHFVQIVVPIALFAPQPFASLAAGLIVFHQFWLIVSGNYSWLNWLTVILGISGFSDAVLTRAVPLHAPMLHPIPMSWNVILIVLTIATVLLSLKPVLNLFSPDQAMNYSYNRYHLVNTYGAFGSVSKERYELVLEGTCDRVLTSATEWKEYAFKAKPGDPRRMPPQIAPYHLRLDWLVWFLPFGVHVTRTGIQVRGYDRWFLRFLKKLLQNDQGVLRLMGKNPFPGERPAYVRALFYQYRYTDSKGKADTRAWWTRELLGTYIEPVSTETLRQV